LSIGSTLELGQILVRLIYFHNSLSSVDTSAWLWSKNCCQQNC